MRIAFIADPLDRQYGGIHVFTKELLLALSKLDSKNEYIIIRSEPKYEFEGMEEVVVPYKSFPGYRLWRLFFQLPKILTQKKVDVVVEPAHFGPFNLPKHIKRVTVIHDMTVFLFPKFHVFLSQFLQRKFLPGILKRADLIITNSNNTTKDVLKFFPDYKDKINSVLLGRDQSLQPQIDEEILKKYNVNQPFILNVGTLEPRKNIPMLIEAFSRFKQKSGASHKLVLIGKMGWKSHDIFKAKEASSFKKDIIWLGYVDKEELPVFYSMAEVFVYPSIYEGFGLPVLEAMMCGTPVITSKNSSLPEVGGSAVLYLDPYSSSELSNQLNRLSADPELREKYSSLGVIQARKFDWDQTARAYLELFENLNK